MAFQGESPVAPQNVQHLQVDSAKDDGDDRKLPHDAAQLSHPACSYAECATVVATTGACPVARSGRQSAFTTNPKPSLVPDGSCGARCAVPAQRSAAGLRCRCAADVRCAGMVLVLVAMAAAVRR
eukprot:2885988-Pleurochrysis_carterae.AAC.2